MEQTFAEKMFELVRQLFLGFGLIALIPLCVYWGVEVIHPTPSFESYRGHLNSAPSNDLSDQELKTRSHLFYEALQQYHIAYNSYGRILFMTAVFVGLMALIGGLLTTAADLRMGLILGSIATLIMGYLIWKYHITAPMFK